MSLDKILAILHLAAGVALITVAAVLSATGHESGLLDAMFGAGAALLPTTPGVIAGMMGAVGGASAAKGSGDVPSPVA